MSVEVVKIDCFTRGLHLRVLAILEGDWWLALAVEQCETVVPLSHHEHLFPLSDWSDRILDILSNETRERLKGSEVD